MISSKTSFLALIGNPVNHSLSPIMQNAAIKHLGLDLVYLAFPCKDEDVITTINSLKKINCKGLNITIPFKEKVFHLCNEISPVAKKIKAINTLKLNEKNEWDGTNTDVAGFKHPLKKYKLKDKKGIVLGSGGAARAAIQGLLELGLSEINIITRNNYSLQKILDDFSRASNIKGSINNNIKNYDLIENSDLIINSTPVGMKKIFNENDVLPFGKDFWRSLNSDTIIYDLIYNPRPTEFLKLGLKRNCITIDGLEMLVAQGARSLSYWTNGLEVPMEVMKEALKDSL
tara:strand:- start:3065 stop:3925 length:861 start_codon:yes stop_codon:yes gene_type:complete